MTDPTGTRVYDKVNECEATVTRTSMVAGKSPCLHLRSDDGQEWCQWPRNVEERDVAATDTVIHSTAIEDICDPRSGEVIVAQGEMVNRRQAQWLGLLIDIGEIEFSELWDVLDTIPY